MAGQLCPGRLERARLVAEVVLSTITGALGLVTIAVPDWLEVVFRVDPDGGNGSLEWAVVAGLLAVSGTLGRVARTRWRRLSRA